eukprot:scaffold2636_cov340-Pavlova_lutheri.AAC.131
MDGSERLPRRGRRRTRANLRAHVVGVVSNAHTTWPIHETPCPSHATRHLPTHVIPSPRFPSPWPASMDVEGTPSSSYRAQANEAMQSTPIGSKRSIPFRKRRRRSTACRALHRLANARRRRSEADSKKGQRRGTDTSGKRREKTLDERRRAAQHRARRTACRDCSTATGTADTKLRGHGDENAAEGAADPAQSESEDEGRRAKTKKRTT